MTAWRDRRFEVLGLLKAIAVAQKPLVQQAWTKHLNSIGIDINSNQAKGGIKSKAELDERLKAADR